MTANTEPKEKKILIIEDNIESQLIYKVYLRSNYSVEFSETGEAGLELIKKNQYDLLLLDINLPGKLSGENVLNIVRKELLLTDFPIIVITAYALKGDKERFIEQGANDYLAKPVDKQVLLNAVAKLI